MAIFEPLSRRRSAGGRAMRLRPWKSILPPFTRPASGSSPITLRQVTVLPEPDSPTMANVSPLSICRSTPRTTSRGPSGVSKPMCRFRISRTSDSMPKNTRSGREGKPGQVVLQAFMGQGGREPLCRKSIALFACVHFRPEQESGEREEARYFFQRGEEALER